MSKLKPNMYKKNIFAIDYQKLKDKYNIKVLLFDFDNTIIEYGEETLNKKAKNLFKSLKEEFIVYIISNSFNSKKLLNMSTELDVPHIGRSMKPLSRGYKKLNFKSIKNNEIAMIGDQLLTDVLGANRMGYFSVLVDPITKDKELLFTRINRILEDKIICEKKSNIKRGKYYD